ncbi:MAG: hypothetical protein AAF242_12565, partial [Bacteroidota bacterium]
MSQEVVVDRILTKNEERALVAKALEIDHIYYTDESYLVSFEGNINYSIVSINGDEKRAINQSAMDSVLAFGDKLYKGRPLSSYFYFDNANIWYYNKFRIYYALRANLYRELLFEKLSRKQSIIKIYTNDQSMPFDPSTLVFSQKKRRVGATLRVLYKIAWYVLNLVLRSIRAWSNKEKNPSTNLIIDPVQVHVPVIKLGGGEKV